MLKYFDKNSLVSQIIIIFLFFNIIAIASFSFYILQQDRKSTTKSINNSLQTIASEKANTVSLVMSQIVKEAESFAEFTNEAIASENNGVLSDNYQRGDDGILYRRVQSESDFPNTSSLFFPSNMQLNQRVINMINATEKLDNITKKMMERNPYLQWAYIATEEGLLRTFPYSSVETFNPEHMQKNDPFYTVANQINNPERKTVWTKPYVDYLGTGWMITCSVPLYDGDEFMGVACVDLRLDTIKEKFLADFRLGDSGIAYLLENSGEIIFHPSFIPTVKNKGQTFLINIIDEPDLDINYKKALKEMIAHEKGVVSYTDSSFNYRTIAYAKVDLQPWTLAIEVNENSYLALANLKKTSFLYLSIAFFLALIALAFFLYKQYSKPLSSLINRAKAISDGDFELKEPINNYTEIETLSNAFNTMSTKIKNYTDNLIKKNNEIQSIINGMGGLLMILNLDLEIITINKKSKDILSKSHHQIKGEKCYEIMAEACNACKGCKANDAIKTKETQYARIICKDDIFQNTYYPVLTKENNVSEVVVYSQKITKQIMLEKELSQKEKMSEIGQLTSAIAHELKNPLAIIKGSSYLLSSYTKDYKNELIDESLATLVDTTENAENVIYSLLDFSSPGKDNYGQGNITKIVDQIILLTRRNSIYRNIIIETKFNPNPLIYYGETEPLKHIFLNLISNAMNVLEPEGKILISGYYKKIKNEDKLILIIKDNGPGIAGDVINKVFEPFYTTDITGKGNGMGLWITKIMVEKMCGSIVLKSGDGVGAEFIITLPDNREERRT